MEFTISLFWVIMIVVLVNTILDHLFNWAFRESYEDEIFVLPVILYLVKTAILILLIHTITT